MEDYNAAFEFMNEVQFIYNAWKESEELSILRTNEVFKVGMLVKGSYIDSFEIERVIDTDGYYIFYLNIKADDKNLGGAMCNYDDPVIFKAIVYAVAEAHGYWLWKSFKDK